MGKKKILIVEDDSFLLTMYANKFEMENFEVLMAEDGKKGLKLALKERPDLILLDLILPIMDGFEVLKEIKADEKVRRIPVILLTNLSQREEVDRALLLGAQDYMIKAHFMPSEVVEKVKNVLKIR
ncbi:MAG: response regulator [Patescibacteria group bacterium]|jgi:DNA-binding response OmpR family regulator